MYKNIIFLSLTVFCYLSILCFISDCGIKQDENSYSNLKNIETAMEKTEDTSVTAIAKEIASK